MKQSRTLGPLCAAVAVAVIATVAAINQAIPSLSSGSLHPSSSTLLWIVDAYVVAFAALLLPAGALADRIGLRRALLVGLALLSLGVLGAALADSAALLIVMRVVSGMGAALCLPTSLSIQIRTLPPERRAAAVATWTAATGLGGAVGNVVGGALIQAGGWRGLFWGFLPVGLLCLVIGVRVFPDVPRHPRPLDLPGTALSGLGFLAVLVGLVEGPAEGWGSGVVVGSFVAGVVLLTAYVLTALRRTHPLLDPRLFGIREVRSSALGIVSLFVALFGLFLCYGQYLQLVKDEKPIVAGVAVLPLVIPFFVCSRLAPRVVARFGRSHTATAGLLIAGIGVLLISTWSAHTPYLRFAATLVLAGVGLGLAGPPLSQELVAALPAERSGVGAALNSTTREVGSALGVAVVGTVTASRFAAAGYGHDGAGAVIARLSGPAAEHAREALAHATADGLRVAVVVLLAGTLLSAWWMRKPSAQPADSTGPSQDQRGIAAPAGTSASSAP